MPFSFLNPWLWLGLIAIGAPLWLHLRRRQQKNLLRFSTLRFLNDQPQAQRSPMQLRDVILFALRALAIVLLVAGFAWPFIRTLNTVPIKESRVYVLDNTLSHQAGNGFTQDRARVQEEITRLDSDVQAAVVELTSSPRVVAAFGETHAAAADAVKDLKGSYQRGSYLAAFRQANTLLQNSLGQTKRIVFLGDNQQNQWTENVSTPPFLRGIEVELLKTPAGALPNLSLSDARVQRLFLGDKSLVNFTVRLSHSGPAKSARVVLKSNGQSVFNKEVPLENQPSTMLLQAQWEAQPDVWLQGEASVEGTPDSLPADNVVFFALGPVIEGRLALLAQSAYLRLALSPEIMRGQWATRILDPNHLSSGTAQGTHDDVLCIESAFLQSTEARNLVNDFLSKGKGVFLIVNRSSPAIDGFLRELGFEVQGIQRPGLDAPEKFQFVLSNHAIFHPFQSPDYGNLMELRVSEYVRLKSGEAMPLVFGEKGEGLFFAGQKGKGKLLVCAFGLDRDHTSWPIHQSFIPFLDLALQAARADDPVPNNYEPGQLATLSLPAANAPELVLRKGTEELARYLNEDGKIRIRLPEEPGLYALTYGEDRTTQKVFSVNPSPKESELAYTAAPETLKLWKINEAPTTQPVVAQVGGLRMAGVLQQRFWWWMVLAALLVLVVETVWAGARKEPA